MIIEDLDFTVSTWANILGVSGQCILENQHAGLMTNLLRTRLSRLHTAISILKDPSIQLASYDFRRQLPSGISVSNAIKTLADVAPIANELKTILLIETKQRILLNKRLSGRTNVAEVDISDFCTPHLRED